MIGTPRVPAVVAARRRWSSDEIEARARAWHDRLASAANGDRRVAIAVGADGDGVALVAAAAARPEWFVLLPPDPRVWPQLALPPNLTVALPPSLAHLAPRATDIGAAALVLPDEYARAGAALDLLASEGIVIFTSGSTGAPRPVYRPMSALLAGIRARLDALELRAGEGVVAGAALGHGHGMTRLLSAMTLGGPLTLLDPLDHRAALAALSDPRNAFWSATAHFADVLGRCRLTGPAIVPRICLLSTPVPGTVVRAFRDRFGVPLRQNYSSSETGSIAIDAGPASEVCPDTVGRPLPGVEVRIGGGDGAETGDEEGRIWVRSRWQMAGYGWPSRLERPGDVDGWWPTRDVGVLRSDGRLVLAGRVDDCIRTREGRLLNVADVARRLRDVRGIDDAAVVPMPGLSGTSFGAVVVCNASTGFDDTRRRVTAALPDWAWPRALVQVDALPRLPGGKIDRARCLALLAGGA